MESIKVLVIEDDPIIVDTVAICFYVCWPEATVVSVATGEEGLVLVENQPPDIIILDLGLPGIDGYQTLKKLREFSETPIILLTAKDTEMGKIKGLELGADDYITKPFSHIVLMARVKAVLRRAPADTSGSARGTYRNHNAGLEIDLDSRVVTRHSKAVNLAPLEYSLLDLLVSNEGRVLSHERILSMVWGQDYKDETAYLKVYIRRLRTKLWDDPQNPELIHTQRGVGYVFQVKPNAGTPLTGELALPGAKAPSSLR
jgi:two-component system KDP operon response regulator KdpE